MLEAYTDADWGSNLDDRRSVFGILIMIGGAPVVFRSKYQRTVALSSAVNGLHIEGYSVPCVLDARDGIPLKEI